MEEAQKAQVRALEQQIQAKAERVEVGTKPAAAAPAPATAAPPAKDAPAANATPEAPAKAAPKAGEKPAADVEAPARDDGKEGIAEDAAASENGDESTAKPPKKKGNFKKRLAEITREKHAERLARESAEQEVAYLRQQMQAGQQPNAPGHRTPAPGAEGKPTLEQYGYDQDAYEAARDAWVIGQAEKSFTARQQQQEQQRRQQEQISAFQTRIRDFEKEVPGGWAEAISAPITFTPPMLEVIGRSEIGPRIGHYLAQNLDEAYQITRLAPYAQAAALGRIEAQLVSARNTPSAPNPSTPSPAAAPAQNTVSRAPAPPPVIPTGSPASTPVDRWEIGDHIAAVQAKRRAKIGA